MGWSTASSIIKLVDPGRSRCRPVAAQHYLCCEFDSGKSFVDQEVAPCFPQGLTIVNGANGSGVNIKECSRVLMIRYRPKPESEVSIEAIREAYKAPFRQESVMRVDGLSCVSF